MKAVDQTEASARFGNIHFWPAMLTTESASQRADRWSESTFMCGHRATRVPTCFVSSEHTKKICFLKLKSHQRAKRA